MHLKYTGFYACKGFSSERFGEISPTAGPHFSISSEGRPTYGTNLSHFIVRSCAKIVLKLLAVQKSTFRCLYINSDIPVITQYIRRYLKT